MTEDTGAENTDNTAETKIEDPPKDRRVIAMLAALFGQDWDKKGEVTFENAPMETWVFAAETMLRAADSVDPIRVALRGLMEEAGSSPDSPALPKVR